MSDLGVLVPIFAPNGFSTRQSAASNTAEVRERTVVSAAVALASTTSEQSAAPSVASTDPLTGLASLTGFTAGLVTVLQETEDRSGQNSGGAGQAPIAAEGGDEAESTPESDGEGSSSAQSGQAGGIPGPNNLTQEQVQLIQDLERTDGEIRRHEQAHASAGGPFAGAPSYDYTRGPNGRLYAVGGDVQIDAAAVPGNPEATIQKMQIVRRAALAPASPSPQDQRVAAIAQQRITEARREQAELELEERQKAADEREEGQARAERLQPGGVSPETAGTGGNGATAAPTVAQSTRNPASDGTNPGGPVISAGAVFNIIA